MPPTFSTAERRAASIAPLMAERCAIENNEALRNALRALASRATTAQRSDPAELTRLAEGELDKLAFALPLHSRHELAQRLVPTEWCHKQSIITAVHAALSARERKAMGAASLSRLIQRSFREAVKVVKLKAGAGGVEPAREPARLCIELVQQKLRDENEAAERYPDS